MEVTDQRIPSLRCLYTIKKDCRDDSFKGIAANARFLAYVKESNVELIEYKTGKHIYTIETPSAAVSVIFSPNGRHLAVRMLFKLAIYDITTGKCVKTYPRCGIMMQAAVFSPNGRLLADGNMCGIKIWDVSSGCLLKELKRPTSSIHNINFSLDSKWIASGSHNGLTIWDVDTGLIAQSIEGNGDITFSPNGKTIWYNSRNQEFNSVIAIWDVVTNHCLVKKDISVGPFNNITFSPDGKYALCGSNKGSLQILDGYTSDSLYTFKGDNRESCEIIFSPDGKNVISESRDRIITVYAFEN